MLEVPASRSSRRGAIAEPWRFYPRTATILLGIRRTDPRATAQYWANFTSPQPHEPGLEQWPWLLCISLGLSNMTLIALRLLQLAHKGTPFGLRTILFGLAPRLGVSSLLLLAPLFLRFHAGTREVCTHVQEAGGGMHSLLSFFGYLCTVQVVLILIELPSSVLRRGGKRCADRLVHRLPLHVHWRLTSLGRPFASRGSRSSLATTPALMPDSLLRSTNAA